MHDQVCALCGAAEATTVDHIPPKGIFPKPRPDNLITVPACFKCNSAASKHDEAFRVFLSLHVGIDSPETQALWEAGALRSVRHNRRLFSDIMTSTKRILLRTKAGIILGTRMVVCWDSTAHDRTIERMIRGLYYHHFGEILGDRVIVKVHWLRGLTDDIFEASKEWTQHSLGRNTLIYRFGRAGEAPLHSIWLFQFYDRHWASGYTSPVATPSQAGSHCTLPPLDVKG